MKIDDSLKIGGRNIKVLRAISSDMGGRSGAYNNWTDTIRIATDSDLSDESPMASLLHEILECLNLHHEYKLVHPVIQSLSENLYQVLRDNKLYFGDE